MPRQPRHKRRWWRWIALALFVVGYPMLLSIYMYFPLCIGVFGYMLLLGIVHNRLHYILFAFIYSVNLDLNVALPFWAMIVALIPVYWLVVPLLSTFRHCKLCMSLIAVLSIDVAYFGVMQLYDMFMQTHTLRWDATTLYSLAVDLLVAVLV